MTGHFLGWTLVVLGTGVAVGNLVRMALVSGWARFEAGAEAVMGGGMAVMAAPPTAVLYGTYGMWWAALFAALCLGGVALSVRNATLRGVRHLRHTAHLVIGNAAMVLMTLAMPGAASGPVLALAGSSGHGHGAMAGMEGMSAHGVTEAAATSGSALLWRVAFWSLAAYFLVNVALAVRAWMRDAGGSPAPAGRRARHRRAPRTPGAFSVPNVRLAGHIGMGGPMATMLVMMAT
ncbi:DUF5134 domain-containing protein [Streptomyces europaeiscabiei]|uniref:DUF5134 domain-containing protein n=1 Tax=Streptomyces europaeiscabiei TaxID=146819 RepID=A0ABU4NJB6_9ACTN|nr:DUF5134 domain-containing protein [Streptomyces europaeiscabiei]MDX3545579.1 DUF5134 domain-containing protein [Streptomyces europaeiscabiei]MDX3555024.1 DUF5134 domain-containing protein [Streptomyces europaeiscabiei]MDX3702711.1 DUF5134 domain-containing protein [Streptomyces europaeiscabiei]MDX3833014.1 DUF5134 domain-containing protein [Streptomyces europaeiscabiei]